MFASVRCAGLIGMQGFAAQVESDVQNGIPGFFLTGALSSETREAQYRVLNAIKNSGFQIKPKKITVNISPASNRKHGTLFDLPIAMAVLESLGELEQGACDELAFMGELGLDGSLKPVNGVLPLVSFFKKTGIKGVVLPEANITEAAVTEGVDIYGFSDLRKVCDFLKKTRSERTAPARTGSSGIDPEKNGSKNDKKSKNSPEKTFFLQKKLKSRIFRDGYPIEDGFSLLNPEDNDTGIPDISLVRGQRHLKRAAEIAVAGRHNILFSGPAGTGKTMLASCLPGIMPRLSREEDIEISMVYSVAGLLPRDRPLLGKRPFRAPHHSISMAAFLGGGMNGVPGEISLSTGGILFLDELPLFRREVLEGLREPLEERRIRIRRLRGTFEYPADFCLVASMNPCPCGRAGLKGLKNRCTCTEAQIRAYRSRLSKPILERIDIFAEARPLCFEDIAGADRRGDSEEDSEKVRERVERVRQIQQERFRDIPGVDFNGRMGIEETERFCVPERSAAELLREVFRIRELSGRTYHRILRVARTIADLDGKENIGEEQVMEAVNLRDLEARL